MKIQKNKKYKKSISEYSIESQVPISYDGKYYIRSGSITLELNGSELSNFLMQKSGRTWDEFIEERANLEHINITTIERFKELAEDRIPSIVREKNWKIVLEKLGLLESGKIKRAAIILFGTNPQKFFIQSCIKIGKFITPTEILSSDMVEGNLFEQIENSLEILKTKYLISKIRFEGTHRRDILEYPYDALREGIINALIHRDYLGTSHIQIRVYKDKLVIMNEGKLPREVSIEKLKTEHLSKPKNLLLARVFYFAGFIESWGRGTIKIVEDCLKQGLPEPDFIEGSGVIKVVFYKDKFTEEFLQKMGFNERQIKAVMYVKKEGQITNKDYQQLLPDISRATATRDFTEIVDKGIFKMVGRGKRDLHYVLMRQK